jgi:hypothetical protein
MLLNFCDDLLIEITKHLMTNKDMINIRKTCIKLKNLTDTYGYIRNIVFGMHTNYMNFIQLYSSNTNSVYKLTMEHLDHPVQWIPSRWPRIMEFNNCKMDTNFINPPKSTTKILQIIDLSRTQNILNINWSKLPELRELYIRSPDMILEGLQNCQNLEVICLDLQNRYREIPPWIAKFPKLRKIIINVFTEKVYHFVSPTLEICLVPKKYPFTSQSKIVPFKHLQENMYINVGGWFFQSDSCVY